MARLRFSYSTVYTFDSDITDHRYKIKCCPANMDRQNIEQLDVSVTPGDYASWNEDSWGNRLMYGAISAAHREFRYEVRGIADVHSSQIDTSDRLVGLFKRQSQFTMPGKLMDSHIERLKTEFDRSSQFRDPYSVCMYINTYVNQLLLYRQWYTNVKTTAEEALHLGEGVCQDYAHIMLGILRAFDIPSRYVVGMMTGEGYSHAWVEAYISTDESSLSEYKTGWYGFDPTNNRMADDGYIKISHGRDYRDCILMRGIFKGNAAQSQQVHVSVAEV